MSHIYIYIFFNFPSIFSMPDLQRNVSFNATVMTYDNQSSFMCVHKFDAPIFTVLHLQSHQDVQNALTEN